MCEIISSKIASTHLKEGQFGDEIGDGVHEGVIGGVVGGGLDSQHNLNNARNSVFLPQHKTIILWYRVLQRVRILVASKQNIWVFQELLADLGNTRIKVSFNGGLGVGEMNRVKDQGF